ncbi:MAG: hypothetical protein IJU18_04785 [Oscillospiraceae bacterium]|nr:hypothetical protein [Oscillospiraceae bacterium]
MKNMKLLIGALSALCLLMALVAFFLPTQQGLALSYMVVFLAVVIGVLCVGGMYRIFFRDK